MHVGEEGRAKLIQSVICTSVRLAKERHMSQLAIKAAVVRQAFGNLLGQVRIRARAKSQVVDELVANLCLDGPARWDADLVKSTVKRRNSSSAIKTSWCGSYTG